MFYSVKELTKFMNILFVTHSLPGKPLVFYIVDSSNFILFSNSQSLLDRPVLESEEVAHSMHVHLLFLEDLQNATCNVL